MNTDTEYSESQITLMVPDLDEAISFYGTTLGLRLKARYGKEFAVLEAPGLTIGLHPQTKQNLSPSMSIGLGVESLEAAMQLVSFLFLLYLGFKFLTAQTVKVPTKLDSASEKIEARLEQKLHQQFTITIQHHWVQMNTSWQILSILLIRMARFLLTRLLDAI